MVSEVCAVYAMERDYFSTLVYIRTRMLSTKTFIILLNSLTC